MYFDARKETEGCITWIQEWFRRHSGDARGIVLGISGGKDSTVAAGLLCRAIGKEKVLGILMPNGEQSDIQDSYTICEYLGIEHRVINIGPAYQAIVAAIGEISDHTKTNIAPRLRMAVLYAIGQERSYRICGTGNLSERFVGYSTKWGDTASDFAPLLGFTSDEVIQIGEELNLPRELIKKAPSDGLTGKTDEENLGFSYRQLNRYIRTGECNSSEILKKILQKHHYNRHKAEAIPSYFPGINAVNIIH